MPLTEEDAITLMVFQLSQIEQRHDALMMIADIHWFLERITMSLTGTERWNEKPSTVMKMAKNYKERKKLWDKKN